MKNIYIGGYAGSGSSAVLDYFRERDEVTTLNYEQRFIVDPDGLLSLALLLNNNPTPYEVDLAVRRFIKLLENLSKKYTVYSYSGYEVPHAASNAFFGALSTVLGSFFFSYRGVWLGQNHMVHQICHKLDRVLGVSISKVFHQITYSLKSNISEKNIFDTFFREYIFNLLGEKMPDYLILDEPYMSFSFSKLCQLSNLDNYLIAVHRDPRDQYLNAKKFKYQFVPQKVEGFVDWFRMQKKLLKQSSKIHVNRLDLNFEDLVLNYDDSTSLINEFIDCKNKDSDKKFEFFNPKESKKNLRQFECADEYAKDIAYIEKELNEYLYYK